jgi:hypothetical protein
MILQIGLCFDSMDFALCGNPSGLLNIKTSRSCGPATWNRECIVCFHSLGTKKNYSMDHFELPNSVTPRPEHPVI